MTATMSITPRQRALIMAGTLVGMLVAAVSQTIVTTVLPSIAQDLDGLSLYTWVFTASMLASAIATPIFGKLSDTYGRRRLYITGVTVFLLGAAACAAAQSMEQLVLARAVQGIGMGAIMPLAMAIVADVVPANDRGKWQGVMGAVFGLATVLGPLAGGWIDDTLGWRWTFWLTLPLGALALLLIITQMHIPFEPRRARLDIAGALTFGGSLAALLLAMSDGGSRYPWDSARIVGLLVASAVLFVAFVVAELRATDPLIPLSLFRDRNVVLTTLAALFVGGGMFAAIFYVPLFMQAVAGLSSSDSGLALVPIMLGLITTSVTSGLLITKTGRYRAVIAAGPIIAIVGFWLMSQLDTGATVASTAWRVAIVGAGLGMVMQNILLVAQNAVEARHTGVVTSVSTLARSVGATIGIAILGTVFSNRLGDDIQHNLASLDPSMLRAAGEISPNAVLGAAESSLPAPVKLALQSAAADALTHVFVLGIPFMIAAFAMVVFLRRDELSDTAAVSVIEELEHELADIVPTDADHAAVVDRA